MQGNDFIELTYAPGTGKRVSRVSIKKSAINMVQLPESPGDVGCIVCVMAQLIPVAESYEYVTRELDARY